MDEQIEDLVKVNHIRIGADEEFALGTKYVGRRMYVSTGAFNVDEIYSDINLNHEVLSKEYVEKDEALKKDYQKFVKKTSNTSYKDFLIYEYDAIAVSDQRIGKVAEILAIDSSNNGAIRKIISAFLNSGYRLENPQMEIYAFQPN